MIVVLGYFTVFGTPIYMVTLLGCLITSIGFLILHFLQKNEHAQLVLYLQFFCQGVLLVFLEVFSDLRQDNFFTGDMLVSWINIMLLPIHKFEVAFFVMTPLILVFHAIDMQNSYDILDKLLAYLPEEERGNFDLGNNTFEGIVARELMLMGASLVVLFCHYNIEI